MELSEKAKQLFAEYPVGSPPRDKPVVDPLTIVTSPNLKGIVVLAPGEELDPATDIAPTEDEVKEFKSQLMQRVLGRATEFTDEEMEAFTVSLKEMDEEFEKQSAQEQELRRTLLRSHMRETTPEELAELDSEL